MGAEGFNLEPDAEDVVQRYNGLTTKLEEKMAEWEQVAEALE